MIIRYKFCCGRFGKTFRKNCLETEELHSENLNSFKTVFTIYARMVLAHKGLPTKEIDYDKDRLHFTGVLGTLVD